MEWLNSKLDKYALLETIKVMDEVKTEIELQDAHKVWKKLLEVSESMRESQKESVK